MASYGDHLAKMAATNPLITSPAPTTEQLAASIGCEPDKIIRSEANLVKTRLRQDDKSVWTSFVDEGDPQRAAVYETLWPQ